MSGASASGLQARLRAMLADQVAQSPSRAAWATARGVPVRAVGMALDGERDVTPALVNALGFMIVPTLAPVTADARALLERFPA